MWLKAQSQWLIEILMIFFFHRVWKHPFLRGLFISYTEFHHIWTNNQLSTQILYLKLEIFSNFFFLLFYFSTRCSRNIFYLFFFGTFYEFHFFILFIFYLCRRQNYNCSVCYFFRWMTTGLVKYIPFFLLKGMILCIFRIMNFSF